nr:hypothetical protein [uncultured Methanosphaera sp.]
MFKITKADCENAINNASEVNDNTIKLWKRCLNKIHKDFIFRSKDELEQQLLDINKTYSSAYNMCSLLRAACKINEVDYKLKEIVYDLYRDLREKSGDEQFENRMNKKQWSLEELISIMRNINMTDYKSTMVKLLLAMYTINPPLRNDYYNVKINDSVNSSNYIDLKNKILNVYCTKSKKYQKVLLCDELIDIINESLIVFPRNYLFTKKNGDNFSSAASLSVSLLNLLKEFMNDKHFSFNTFRHAYAEWSMKQDVKTRINAADSMLHSRLTHMSY